MVSPYLSLYKYILECENNESSAGQKEGSSGAKVVAARRGAAACSGRSGSHWRQVLEAIRKGIILFGGRSI